MKVLEHLDRELQRDVNAALYAAQGVRELDCVKLTRICNSVISCATPDVEAVRHV